MSIRSKHCETWVPEKLPSFPKPGSMRRKCGYCKVVPDPVHNSLTCPLQLQQSGRKGATKKPLMSLTNRTQGKQRIRELVDMFDNFCEVNNEDKKDVLAFEYRRTLYNDGKPRSAKTFESFHQQPSQILVQPPSPRKTAGRVVVTGQSWNESRDNFTYTNQHGLPVYAGPSGTDLYRWSVSPMNVSYQMESIDKKFRTKYKAPEKPDKDDWTSVESRLFLRLVTRRKKINLQNSEKNKQNTKVFWPYFKFFGNISRFFFQYFDFFVQYFKFFGNISIFLGNISSLFCNI